MTQQNGREIILRPDNYLAERGKTLDDRISEVKLPPGTEEVITRDRAKKVIRDRLLGLFKIGEVVSEILNWNAGVDEDIKAAKKSHLIATYFESTDENTTAVSDLKKLLTSASGNTLFNKILRILDDNPPDPELTNHLSAALKYIAESDFKSLFEQHKYALAQIDQISPRGLAILSDHKNWPTLQLGSYTASGGLVTSDWLLEFTTAYVRDKGITEGDLVNRVQYSVSELQTRRLIEARLEPNSVAKCTVTSIGRLLLPYI
jgi:hypothetical protein